jgi:hypothetical protein
MADNLSREKTTPILEYHILGGFASIIPPPSLMAGLEKSPTNDWNLSRKKKVKNYFCIEFLFRLGVPI